MRLKQQFAAFPVSPTTTFAAANVDNYEPSVSGKGQNRANVCCQFSSVSSELCNRRLLSDLLVEHWPLVQRDKEQTYNVK